jgi:hypothetical protein
MFAEATYRPITCILISLEVAGLAESLRGLYSSSQPPTKLLDVPLFRWLVCVCRFY